MITLHIANKNYSSWSLRPWILMRALNIPFEEQIHPLTEHDNWNNYRQFSPSGKVPCLQVSTQAVWDSLAIAEYLAEEYPRVWPSDKRARTWARCAAAEMHSGFQTLRNTCGMNCGVRVQLHTITPALQKDTARIEALWCEGLTEFGGPFLAGKEFTAVDAFFAPVVFRVQTYGLTLNSLAQGYLKTMLALPALQRWYEEALAETWREPAHEREVLEMGKIISDARKK